MTERASHPLAQLQDLVDHRLAGEVLAEVEAHVAECEACRAELEALRRAKVAVATVSPPPDLDDRIRAALDAEDTGGDKADVVPIRRPLYRRRELWSRSGLRWRRASF